MFTYLWESLTAERPQRFWRIAAYRAGQSPSLEQLISRGGGPEPRLGGGGRRSHRAHITAARFSGRADAAQLSRDSQEVQDG